MSKVHIVPLLLYLILLGGCEDGLATAPDLDGIMLQVEIAQSPHPYQFMLKLTVGMQNNREEPIYYGFDCDSLWRMGLDAYLLSRNGDRLYLDNPSERPECEMEVSALAIGGQLIGHAVINGIAYTSSGEAVPLKPGRYRVVALFAWASDRESLFTAPVREQRIASFEWREELKGR